MRPDNETMNTLYKTPFTKATIGSQLRPVEMMQELDPMMLWFLNTTGVPTATTIKLIDDPNLFQSRTNSEYIFCDNCLGE